MAKAYKIFRERLNCKLVSYLFNDEGEKELHHGFVYDSSCTNYPLIGKFFTFFNIEDAFNFLDKDRGFLSFDNLVIYEVECTNLQLAKEMSDVGDSKSVKSFWVGEGYRVPPPKGTYFADSVKLIRRVCRVG